MRAKHFTISYFVCPECKKIFPLPRNQSFKRKKGHIKDLYCAYCDKIVKTIEIRDEDFL